MIRFLLMLALLALPLALTSHAGDPPADTVTAAEPYVVAQCEVATCETAYGCSHHSGKLRGLVKRLRDRLCGHGHRIGHRRGGHCGSYCRGH